MKQTSEWQAVMLHSQRSRSCLIFSFIATFAGRISASFRALQTLDEPIERINLNTDSTNPAFSFCCCFGLGSDHNRCLRLQIWCSLSCCHCRCRVWNIFLFISLTNYQLFWNENVTMLTGAILGSSSTKIFTPGSFAFNAFFTSCS